MIAAVLYFGIRVGAKVGMMSVLDAAGDVGTSALGMVEDRMEGRRCNGCTNDSPPLAPNPPLMNIHVILSDGRVNSARYIRSLRPCSQVESSV